MNEDAILDCMKNVQKTFIEAGSSHFELFIDQFKAYVISKIVWALADLNATSIFIFISYAGKLQVLDIGINMQTCNQC